MSRAALLLAALMAAPPAQAYMMLDGPMPSLGPRGPTPAAQITPAPIANPDITAPATRAAAGPTLAAGLLDRRATPGASTNGFTPGSAFSDQVDRRNRSTGGFGSQYVPTISIRAPLQ